MRNPDERKNFLKGAENAVVPFMEAILQIDNNLTIEEERIYNKIK